MTISRGQMKRQLYEGGGIMSLSKEGIGGGSIKGVDMGSRIGFFNPFKSAKKAVKKVTKGVKGILSSDLGKAALGAAALYYAPKFGIKAAGGLKPFLVGAPTNLVTGKEAFAGILGTGGQFAPSVGKIATSLFGPTGLSKVSSAITGSGTGSSFLTKGLALAGLTSFLTSQYGMTEEQAEEVTRDPEQLQSYLRMYYTNLNPNAGSEEIEEFVRVNSATGGRIGFENGSEDPAAEPDSGSAYMQDFSFPGQEKAEEFLLMLEDAKRDAEEERRKNLEEMYRQFLLRTEPMEVAEGGRIGFADGPVLPPDTTQPVNPFGPKPGDFGIDEDIPIKKMASNLENEKILEALFEKYLDMGLSPKDAAEKAQEEFERMSKRKMEPTIRGVAALGGKMDTASDNAMQAAGIEGLPIRENPKGVKELDLRETGGFIQPVGIKEKEDDIPAMLSNNEFVFTADAVRGAGGGDVNLGAQRMYDTMKRLEAGGKA